MEHKVYFSGPGVYLNHEDLLQLVREQPKLKTLIPQGYEPLPPRVVKNPAVESREGKRNRESVWYVECLWYCVESGAVRYFTKVNPITGILKEFKLLSGEIRVKCSRDEDVMKKYLEKCAAVLSCECGNEERFRELDRIWKGTVPEVLHSFLAAPETAEVPVFMPQETLTAWSWERVSTIMLAQKGWTMEDGLDYLAYKESDSELPFVESKYRARARAEGIRFWRDGNDGK